MKNIGKMRIFFIVIGVLIIVSACRKETETGTERALEVETKKVAKLEEGVADVAEETQELKKAPDFTLKNLQGEKITLSELGAKPVLLNFWTTWCPYCQREIPDLKRIHSEYGGKIILLGIDIKESKKKVESYVQKRGITYPVLLDERARVAKLFRVMGTPTSIVLDSERKIRYFGYDLKAAESMLSTLIP